MKYVKQLAVILAFSFLGELLHAVIPLPVPASIYGMLALFLALVLKAVPLSAVEDTGSFLVDVMPVMFLPAAAGLMDSFGLFAGLIWPVLIAVTVLTALVMGISGRTAQRLIRLSEARL